MNNKILDNVKALRTGIKNFLTEEQNLPDDAPSKLRGKQTEVFEALLKPEFSDEDIARGYFKLPTGFGKTVMFAYLTKSFLNETSDSKKKILVLVPRINLLEQTDEKFDKFIGVDTSYFYGKEKNTSSRVIISTYQSLSNLLKNINKEDIDLIIADEAHHSLGENTSKIFKDLQKYAPTIAFTATPNYSNDKKLANLFSKEIYSMTTIDAVQNNMLVSVKNILLRSSIEFDLSQVKKKNDGNFDYEKIASSISMETLSKEIAKAYLYGEDKDEEGNSFRFFGKKAMISCPNVKTAIAQAEKLNELAGQVIAKPIFQHMGMSSRFGKFDETVEDFKNNKFLVACQVNTLTEGFDDTEVSISINYPTASPVREEQSAGRALRINEEDPNKVAYVIDTVFSVGHDDENPFETAQKARQVLFSDVAGASVIFPENFKHKKEENDRDKKDKERFPLPPPDIEIPEFKIFTDTEKLLQVFNDGKIQVKDKNWYFSADLDDNFVGGKKKMIKSLKQASIMPEFKDTVKLMKSGTHHILCLHENGLELFKQVFNLKEKQKQKQKLEDKTKDWFSAKDLNNKFVGGNIKIAEYLNQASMMPEFKDTVKLMKSGSAEPLCLHTNGLELFKQVFNLKEKEKQKQKLEDKTKDWFSAKDLTNKLVGNHTKIAKSLNQASMMPEFKNTVKLMKSGSAEPLCLHKNGLELFKQVFNLKEKQKQKLEDKTKDWFSLSDLNEELVGDKRKIAGYLKQASMMPEFKNTVKLMQSGSQQPLCIHKDALELFKQTFGILDLPKKTEDWLSAKDLKNKFVGKPEKLQKYLKQALTMPEFKNTVKLMQNNTQRALCLHKDGLDLFKDTFKIKEKQKDLPKKTKGWYSANDLAKELGGDNKNYKKCLEQAVNMPKFKDTVKLMKSGRYQTLFLHEDGLIDFVQTFKIKIRDPEMFEKAIKKIEQKIAMEEEVQKTNIDMVSNKQNDGR